MTAAISSNNVMTPQPAVHGKRGCLSYLRRVLLALVILIVALPLTGYLYEMILAAGTPAPEQLVPTMATICGLETIFVAEV